MVDIDILLDMLIHRLSLSSFLLGSWELEELGVERRLRFLVSVLW